MVSRDGAGGIEGAMERMSRDRDIEREIEKTMGRDSRDRD